MLIDLFNLYKNECEDSTLTENEQQELIVLARDFCLITDGENTKTKSPEDSQFIKELMKEKTYSSAHRNLMTQYFNKYD